MFGENTDMEKEMTNYNMSLKRRAWRPKEVAEMCGLSIAQVYKDLRSGKLEKKKKGRAVLILDEEVTRYLNQD